MSESSNDRRSSNENDGISPRGSSAKYVVFAACVFGLFVLTAVFLLSRANDATQQNMLPIIATGLCGGLLKLINILQNRATDRKVTEDVHTTKQVAERVEGVHVLVNGGLKDRIKVAVQEALKEQQAAPPADPNRTTNT